MDKRYTVLIKVDIHAPDDRQAAAKAYQALMSDKSSDLSFIVVDTAFKQQRVKLSVQEACGFSDLQAQIGDSI